MAKLKKPYVVKRNIETQLLVQTRELTAVDLLAGINELCAKFPGVPRDKLGVSIVTNSTISMRVVP